MAKHGSFLDDLLDRLIHLPWWVSGAMAPISYWLLSRYAAYNSLTNPVLNQLLQILSALAPLVALMFVTISGVMLYDRWHRRRLQVPQQSIEAIRHLSWLEFEWLIGEAMRRQGYRAIETRRGEDGGIDLILLKDRYKILVQCKYWKRKKIGVRLIRELHNRQREEAAQGSIFVCAGKYSQAATDFAFEQGIRLFDGEALEALFREVRHEPAKMLAATASWVHKPAPKSPDFLQSTRCPRCGSAMTKRYAKRGEHFGKPFWGCTAFPKCRGVLAEVVEPSFENER